MEYRLENGKFHLSWDDRKANLQTVQQILDTRLFMIFKEKVPFSK